VKLKIQLVLIFSLMSFIIQAEDLVRLDTDFNNFTINGTTNKTITLNFDKPTQQPTDEANAPKVYAPMQKTLGGDSKLYYLYNTGGTTEIFNNTDLTKVINFPLRIFAGVSDLYVYAAVYNADSGDAVKWEIIKAYPGNPVKNLTNSPITFTISPADICARTSCTGLEAATSTTKVTKTYKLNFFITTNSSLLKGAQVDVTQAPFNNGIYFNVGLSNKFYDKDEFTGTIIGVRRGDRRLFLEFTSTGILDPLDIRVVSHPVNASGGGENDVDDFPGALPIGNATYKDSSVLTESYAYSQNGELNVRNLNNDQNYIFSFVMVNKYLFATPLSNAAKEQPAQIEELLTKNSCFLLTAGFGEDHYIIDYFRHFRDQVLLKNYFGKKFVSVYYEMAPKYALIIYENEFLRSVIRGAAYILYFAFTHIYLMLLGAILIPIYFVWAYTLRKIKTLKT